MESSATRSPEADFGPLPCLAPAVRRRVSGRDYSLAIRDGNVVFTDLSNDNVSYDADVSPYLPLLFPKLTKQGKVAKRQPDVPKQPAVWWRAQCAFRGIPVSGSVDKLQERLREHGGRGLSAALHQARSKMIDEYTTQNAAAIASAWAESNDADKLRIWPRRFVQESILDPSIPNDTVITSEVFDWGEAIQTLARQLNFACEMLKMPDHQTGQRCVVLGRDTAAVKAKFAEIWREGERAVARVRQQQQDDEERAQEDFNADFELAAKRDKRQAGKWNVCGEWRISCPKIESNWPSESGEPTCSLTIASTQPDANGFAQIFATFDFNVLTGVMRFLNPDHSEERGTAERTSATKHGSDTEAYDDDERSLDDESHYDHRQFEIGSKSMPSLENSDFSFRWRGEETGEGEIQLTSDEELCSIHFESPHAMTGIFEADLVDRAPFKGYKATASKAGQSLPSSAKKEWSARSAAAYESARVGRWG